MDVGSFILGVCVGFGISLCLRVLINVLRTRVGFKYAGRLIDETSAKALVKQGWRLAFPGDLWFYNAILIPPNTADCSEEDWLAEGLMLDRFHLSERAARLLFPDVTILRAREWI